MQLYYCKQKEVRQAKFSNENRCNEGKAESSTGAMQWSGQVADREDIKRVYTRPAGSKGQAANGQSRENSPGNKQGKYTWGKCSEMSDGAKQDFAVSAWMCAAYMCVCGWCGNQVW